MNSKMHYKCYRIVFSSVKCIHVYFEMKHKIRYKVGEIVVITLTFIVIKFVTSHPVEEFQKDETARQRHAIFEPQNVADYVESDEFKFALFDSSTKSPKREVKTTQVMITTTQVAVTPTEGTTATEFAATEAQTFEAPSTTTVVRPKKRGKIINEVIFCLKKSCLSLV